MGCKTTHFVLRWMDLVFSPALAGFLWSPLFGLLRFYLWLSRIHPMILVMGMIDSVCLPCAVLSWLVLQFRSLFWLDVANQHCSTFFPCVFIQQEGFGYRIPTIKWVSYGRNATYMIIFLLGILSGIPPFFLETKTYALANGFWLHEDLYSTWAWPWKYANNFWSVIIIMIIIIASNIIIICCSACYSLGAEFPSAGAVYSLSTKCYFSLWIIMVCIVSKISFKVTVVIYKPTILWVLLYVFIYIYTHTHT